MLSPSFDHFKRAANEIAAHGDNDTLPFDIDTKFCGDKADELAHLASTFYEKLKKGPQKENGRKIGALDVFSERLIAPSGAAGFRVVTKIHPFWNIYFNGLGISIAETLELIYAELSGDFPLGDSRQPIYKSLRPFDLVS